MRKIIKRYVHFLLVIILFSLAGFLYLMFGPIHLNKNEKAFIHHMQERLQKPGDWVLVSDLNPEPWQYVCLKDSESLSGSVGIEIMQRKFGDMVLGIDDFGSAYATDSNWLTIFFDPNKSIEYLRIPNSRMREHGALHDLEEEWPICRERSNAIFVLTEIKHYNGVKTIGVQLRTKNNI